MKRYTAEMPSFTLGAKGEKLLRARGFPCELVRRSTGCGYDLIFNDVRALNALDGSGIPYKLKDIPTEVHHDNKL